MRRWLASAEAFRDRATAPGLRSLNTPGFRSMASLLRMTCADHFLPARAARRGFLADFLAAGRTLTSLPGSCGAPGLRQADGNGLSRGAGAVRAVADVVHLLTDELSRLGCGRFSLKLVASRSLQCPAFRHEAVLLIHLELRISSVDAIEPRRHCLYAASLGPPSPTAPARRGTAASINHSFVGAESAALPSGT